MTEVRRSGAVTASTVIALIGSIMSLAGGGLMVLAVVAANRPEMREAMARQPGPPVSPIAMMTVMSVAAVAFAGWGCASAVAVFRLKRWGRISFLVFGGILAAAGAVNAIGSVLMMTVFSAMSLPDPNVPRGLFVGMAGAMGFVSLLMCALGVWWLILFNRASVKTLFVAPGQAEPTREALPISIVVIAWLLVSSFLALPFLLFVRSPGPPAFLFGYQLGGGLAVAFFVVQFSVAAVAGIGLLRRRFRAHALAVGFYLFGLINFAFMAVRPGGLRRVIDAYQPPPGQQILPASFFDSMLTFITVSGLVFSLVIIALLLSARTAYLRACNAPRSSPAS